MKRGYKIGGWMILGLLVIGLVMVIVASVMGASLYDATVSGITPNNNVWTIFGTTRHDRQPPASQGTYQPDAQNNAQNDNPAYWGEHQDNDKVFLRESYTDVTSLEFDIGESIVTVDEGDTFSIVASGTGKEFSSKVESGKWRIYARGYEKKWKSGKSDQHYTVHITLPRGFVAQTANIDLGMGTMEVERLAAQQAVISVGMGEIEINDLTSPDTAVDCGMGNIELEGAMTSKVLVDCGMGNVDLSIRGRESDYGYLASVGMGNIDIGGKSRLAGIAGDSSMGLDRPNQLEISCGMGNISIDFDND